MSTFPCNLCKQPIEHSDGNLLRGLREHECPGDLGRVKECGCVNVQPINQCAHDFGWPRD